MYTISLTRAARCGGVQSLSHLCAKLARAGETSALAALAPLPDRRVAWLMFGTVLIVREVRHA